VELSSNLAAHRLRDHRVRLRRLGGRTSSLGQAVSAIWSTKLQGCSKETFMPRLQILDIRG
jgi:hypothetical protein